MLTESIIDFLHGPQMTYLGTVSADGKPCVHRSVGLQVSADGERVQIFVPDVFAGPLRDNVAGNPQISLTSSNGGNFETYQLKGRAVGDVVAGNAEQEARSVQTRDTWVNEYGFMGEGIIAFFRHHPTAPRARRDQPPVLQQDPPQPGREPAGVGDADPPRRRRVHPPGRHARAPRDRWAGV